MRKSRKKVDLAPFLYAQKICVKYGDQQVPTFKAIFNFSFVGCRSFFADDYHFFLEKADSLFLRFSKLVSNWDFLRKFHLLFLWIKFESCQRIFRCCISHRISSIWRFICNSDYVPLFPFAEYFHFFPK